MKQSPKYIYQESNCSLFIRHNQIRKDEDLQNQYDYVSVAKDYGKRCQLISNVCLFGECSEEFRVSNLNPNARFRPIPVALGSRPNTTVAAECTCILLSIHCIPYLKTSRTSRRGSGVFAPRAECVYWF